MTVGVYLQQDDINGGTPVRVMCTKITPSIKVNNVKTPNSNIGELVEVQTNSFENPKYLCNGIKYTTGTDILTWEDVLTLAQLKYDGTNAATLTVTHKDYNGNEVVLPSLSGATSGIKVLLDETPSINIDVADSRDGYLPTGNLIFIETK